MQKANEIMCILTINRQYYFPQKSHFFNEIIKCFKYGEND